MGGSLIPQWIDRARPLVGLLIVGVPLYLVGLFYYGASPKTIDVGYMPDQPVPFSHALHAGKLGMDCRYCHTTVERAAHAALGDRIAEQAYQLDAAMHRLLSDLRAFDAAGYWEDAGAASCASCIGPRRRWRSCCRSARPRRPTGRWSPPGRMTKTSMSQARGLTSLRCRGAPAAAQRVRSGVPWAARPSR